MTGAANANFGTCGNDNGNDEGGNDGGKWESTFAAPVFAPMVIVLVAKVVNFVVIVIISIVVGVSVIICGTVVVFLFVSVIATLIKSSLPSTIVRVQDSGVVPKLKSSPTANARFKGGIAPPTIIASPLLCPVSKCLVVIITIGGETCEAGKIINCFICVDMIR